MAPATPRLALGGREKVVGEGLVWVVPTVPCVGSLPADRLLSLTLLAFEGLNTAISKDRCLACIEEPFFSPLWPLLLALYRCHPSPSALQVPHVSLPFPSRAHL